MNFVLDGMPRRKRGRPKSMEPSAFPAKKNKIDSVQPAAPVLDDPVLSDTTITFDLDISNLTAEKEVSVHVQLFFYTQSTHMALAASV